MSTPKIKSRNIMQTLETEANEGPDLPPGYDLPSNERPGYYKRKRSIDMSLYHSL